MDGQIAFGPVPSRRLGTSLGINNIPAKTCTYSCIYCQIGRTTNLRLNRGEFCSPDSIISQVREKVKRIRSLHGKLDYLTFVPDGEPTLDTNLGREISQLKTIGIPIAVITNASLLWQKDIREDLMEADLVSLKVDSVDEIQWKLINRPHGKLILKRILDGIEDFATSYSGKLISETMLVKGININSLKISDFLSHLDRLDVAYLSTVTRPPAERWVGPVDDAELKEAREAFSERLGNRRIGYLVECEGSKFTPFGKVAEEELLGIMAVHPMREDALRNFLLEAGEDWGLVDRLMRDGKIVEVKYGGQSYFRQEFPRT